ncbi:GSCFA domain-containing protein [Aquibium sp. LZ166]|uniref:GSCFA domain-containing protein n=1 Tax=Aquibium pacificus TaxID=3153579 RepID=A0ABV3SSG1_9HYPH
MRTVHPYRTLPAKAFWRRSVAALPMAEVDPVGRFDLRITPQSRVATAGSCFAQHIARHLSRTGFDYMVAEPGHPILPEVLRAAHGYGTFSARYGNIYTSRQLRQLVDRSWDRFQPTEAPWLDSDGTVRDPFRPAVQPGNFISVAEMEADRRQHLTAVRGMFETLDVFVFTLGLTECWISSEDGAVFPICPGVEGGTFDPARYVFHNLTVEEVVADMQAVVDHLAAVNPSAQVVLTVSPVPLAATALPDGHVLTSTTYSKSVLRVAAQMLSDNNVAVHYFPSYEIITGSFNRGSYYADDLRNVLEEGVSHVMRLFLLHAAGILPGTQVASNTVRSADGDEEWLERVAQFVEVECEEAFLEDVDRDTPSAVFGTSPSSQRCD